MRQLDVPISTMRRLLLFRHAKAEPAVPGIADRERALTERGRRDAARIGLYMASHALIPDWVILSPAVRAQQTWKQTAAAFKPEPPAATADTLYDATAYAILATIKEAPAPARSLLVVGHNPGLHDLALMLVASGDVDARERLREKLPTSALAIVDFAFDHWSRLHPQSGRLERLVSPRMLEVHSEGY
jgi:phosphohistidine phosphatase